MTLFARVRVVLDFVPLSCYCYVFLLLLEYVLGLGTGSTCLLASILSYHSEYNSKLLTI